MFMETVSECELNCLELQLLELENKLTTLTKQHHSNIYFPNSTIDLTDYVSGIGEYTIYYTIDKITEPDEEGGYSPSSEDTSIPSKFKNNRYTIPSNFTDYYGIYEVYEGSEESESKKLLTRFVIITKSEGAGYYNIEGELIGDKITGNTLSYNDKPTDSENVAWVIVPNTVTEFKVVNRMGVFDNNTGGFPKLIACYFEKHTTRNIIGNGYHMFRNDSNLVAVNYNDLISYLKEGSFDYMFVGCTALTEVNFAPNIFNGIHSDELNITYLFAECIGLIKVNFSANMFNGLTIKENTSFNISSMFVGCTALTEVNFAADMFNGLNINESAVFNINYMFNSCSSLKTVNFAADMFNGLNINESAIFNIRGMFEECTSLNTVNFVPYMFNGLNINESAVFNISRMFFACVSLEYVKLIDLFSISKYIFVENMFNNCPNIKSITIIQSSFPITLSQNFGENHNYNLFTDRMGTSQCELHSTDAVVNMLLNLNTISTQISLTCNNPEIREAISRGNNEVTYKYTLSLNGFVFDITEREQYNTE